MVHFSFFVCVWFLFIYDKYSTPTTFSDQKFFGTSACFKLAMAPVCDLVNLDHITWDAVAGKVLQQVRVHKLTNTY
jgi:hypothetical protein